MVHELEVPQPLAGLEVDGDEALREQVVAGPVAAVVVAGGDLDREVGDAQLLVDGQVGPHPGVPGVDGRVVQPRVASELAGPGDGVEDPPALAGAGVVAADVALDVLAARGRPAGAVRGPDDDHVAGDDGGAVPPDLAGQGVDGLVVVALEVDDAVDPEPRHGPPRARVEPDELVADGDQVDALVALAVGPVGDAAARHAADGVHPPLAFVEAVDPQQLAGGRVERHHVAAAAGGGVEHAVDHQGRGLVVEVGERPEVGGAEAPLDLEVVEVVGGDLVERGVPGAAQVAAVGPPLAAGRAVLGEARGRSGEEQHRRHCHRHCARTRAAHVRLC